MDEELVEKVAKSMAEDDAASMGTEPHSPKWTWDKLFDENKRYWRSKARAAIQAIMDAGWVPAKSVLRESSIAFHRGFDVGRGG